MSYFILSGKNPNFFPVLVFPESQKGRNCLFHSSCFFQPSIKTSYFLVTTVCVSLGQIHSHFDHPVSLSQEALLHLHTLPCFTNKVSKRCWQSHVSHKFCTSTQAFAMGVILFHSPYFSGVTDTNKCSHAQEDISTCKYKKKKWLNLLSTQLKMWSRTSGKLI